MRKATATATKAKEPVKIRFKKMANGNLSVYLDVYQDGKRVYDFLKIYLVPEVNDRAIALNKKNLAIAETIKAKRIIELNTSIHGISNQKERSKTLLGDYIRHFAETKINLLGKT